MKNLLNKILTLIAIVLTVSVSLSAIAPQNTFADFKGRADCKSFLGLTPWDCGVNITNEEELKTGIWQIVANVAVDVAVIAAYLVLGYVIYGGYLYIFSSGDPGKVANGKKTLVQAFIGLAIVMLANLILGTIRIVLVASTGGEMGDCTTAGSCANADPGVLIESLIRWFTIIAGVVSSIFLVYGGVSYITSSGDPGKLKKAKDAIIYSLIGLAVVALATIITAFVSNMIRDAKTTSSLNNNYISKEVHEIKNN